MTEQIVEPFLIAMGSLDTCHVFQCIPANRNEHVDEKWKEL